MVIVVSAAVIQNCIALKGVSDISSTSMTQCLQQTEHCQLHRGRLCSPGVMLACTGVSDNVATECRCVNHASLTFSGVT